MQAEVVYMINLIYGEKGTGKTKMIIDQANDMSVKAKGEVVFITDSDQYMFSLSHKIRLIQSAEYHIETELGLLGFIRGLVAGNTDIQYIYIDGAARMTKKKVEEMEEFYCGLEKVTNHFGLNIILTVSASKEKLPDFMKKYI